MIRGKDLELIKRAESSIAYVLAGAKRPWALGTVHRLAGRDLSKEGWPRGSSIDNVTHMALMFLVDKGKVRITQEWRVIGTKNRAA